MATMKDIAKIAGVSHGTVSNVLNGRGNVSVEKMEIVLKAAEQAGYRLNTQAQLLRSNSSNKIAVVLPQLLSEKYAVFFNAFRQTFDEFSDISFDLFFTDDLKANELAVLKKIASGGYKQVVTVSCLDDATIYFDTLQLSPENIIFIYRRPNNAKVFYTLDYDQAIKAIFGQVNIDEIKVLGIFADELCHLNSQAFIEAIDAQIIKHKTRIKLVHYDSSDEESYKTAFEFFSQTVKFDFIIAQDIEKACFLTQASNFGSAEACPAIYTLTSNTPLMIEGLFCFPVNYAQLGQDVVNYLIGNNEYNTTTKVANLGNKIYTGSKPASHNNEGNKSLNLLTLPSPSTTALQKLLPNFYRQTGIHVNLAIRPFDEIYNILNQIDDHPYYDLIRIDVACYPWFAQKSLLPLNQIGHGITDLLDKFTEEKQKRFSIVNGIPYGIPFDASVQLLFYRKDLFEDAVLKRMYFESTGKELRPPVTFEEYDRITHFFYKHKEVANPMRPAGASTTMGSAGLISSEFLLRYYAAGGRLVGSKTQPRLQPDLAQAVLKTYIEQLPITDSLNSEWWSDSIAHFEQGNLAMIIAYMNLFNDVAHSPMSPKIDFTSVPGGIPQIGGGVIGVSRHSQKGLLAEQFYRWLHSSVITDHLLMLGGNNIQKDFIHSQEVRHRYPWLPLAYEEINVGIRESTTQNGNVFNLRRAEIIIGQGVRNTIDKIMSIEEAIEYININLQQIDN
ncbi:extracellular solute-binding protein [Providencia burhodogranariea]|uniref:LacI family transcriptional regulator n=1 Tax=Providencia burhodogranariea DSM 19968 TaxID=1141662 RepID=K8X5D2_9GAMM|nr:LacI family transcriptional regulator [Providencia burhodogranariea DSM 19968]